MTLDELRAKVEAGELDTVLLALTDMQGRLQGKRLTARPWSSWRSNTEAQGVSKIYFSGGGNRNRNYPGPRCRLLMLWTAPPPGT